CVPVERLMTPAPRFKFLLLVRVFAANLRKVMIEFFSEHIQTAAQFALELGLRLIFVIVNSLYLAKAFISAVGFAGIFFNLPQYLTSTEIKPRRERVFHFVETGKADQGVSRTNIEINIGQR